MSSPLSDNPPDPQGVLEVKPLAGGRFEVRLTHPDFLGLLSVVTGLFASYGLTILHGRVGTVGRKAEDVFEVSALTPPDWKAFEKDLAAIARKYASGRREEARREINQRIVHFLRSRPGQGRGGLSPISLEIDQQASPRETVVEIRAEDTPAFLYELTNALSLLGINIVRMEIDTVDNRVQDRLWVTTESGEKITAEEKLRALRWAVLLVKQFTHLLPRVPDPAIALEQITLFGRDVFSRKDFSDVLLALKQSKTLEDLSRVFGTSRFLWEEFIRSQHESIFPVLADDSLLKLKKDRALMACELEAAAAKKKTFEEKVAALNEFKDREMFRIDLRHILGRVSYLEDFAQEFTDLAEAVVGKAFELAQAEAARTHAAPGAGECAVLALGKFGGRELGYASDLEVLFVYREGPDAAASLEFYQETVRLFRKSIHARAEGVFEIDLRLRPHGKDGPLASSLDSFKKYYRGGGEAWAFERQALVKLRAVAGDARTAEEALAHRDRFVYGPEPYDFTEAQTLRERQKQELVKPGTFNAKYSAGGLLDMEYLIQTMQMAYGRRFTQVRHPNTLHALNALWEAGAVDEKLFQSMRAAYIFLRSLINALRIVRGNAKDLTLPAPESEEYTVLARRIGYFGEDEAIRQKFRRITARYVDLARTLYERGMQDLARMSWDDIPARVSAGPAPRRVTLDSVLRGELSSTEAQILRAVGFRDLEATLERFKRACPSPLAFESFALAFDRAWSLWPGVPDPDLAAAGLERLAESMIDQEAFWDSLAENQESLGILLKLLGSSRYLAELLIQHPDDWSWVQSKAQLEPALTRRALQALEGRPLGYDELRRLKHRETLRLALSELAAGALLEEVFSAYTSLADFILGRALSVSAPQSGLCIIGLGKLGGGELNFSSDVDIFFLAGPGAEAPAATRGIEAFLREVQKGTPEEFLYRVDLRLRPHGDKGSLLMTEAEYRHYYEGQAEPWERHVLLKARPAAGGLEAAPGLAEFFSKLVYEKPWNADDLENVRDVKRRFEEMTAAKGESETNIKLGTGGIRDIEFSVQMRQILHGPNHPALRTPNHFRALEALRASAVFSAEEAETLRQGYEFLRKIENRLQLYENRQVFNLPAGPDQRWLARSMGFEDRGTETAQDLFHAKLSTIRRKCRSIFERAFYG